MNKQVLTDVRLFYCSIFKTCGKDERYYVYLTKTMSCVLCGSFSFILIKSWVSKNCFDLFSVVFLDFCSYPAV